MIKDIKKEFEVAKKKGKLHLCISLVFLFLSVASVILFTVFSNYKIQVLMSILGSVTSSILSGFFVYFLVFKSFAYFNYSKFFSSILNIETEEVVLKNFVIKEHKMTMRKGVEFAFIKSKDNEFFSFFDDVTNEIANSKTVKILVKGQFIVGVKKNG